MAEINLFTGEGIDNIEETAADTVASELYWTEKYRGTNLSEIILPGRMETMVKTALTQTSFGNYIFYSGSAGTGKTSLALAIPNMLGATGKKFKVSRNETEVINAIDDYSIIGKQNGKPIFFILDECDHPNKPEDFWRVIQSVIEDTSSNLRFILTCNELWRIPKAVQSRCTPICFDHPAGDSNNEEIRTFKRNIYKRLKFIADSEVVPLGGKVEKETLCELVQACYPDIREMINAMHLTFLENGGNIVGHPHIITDATLSVITGYLFARDTRGLRYYISANVNNFGGMYVPLGRYLFDRIPVEMDMDFGILLGNAIKDMQGQVNQEIMLMRFCFGVMKLLNKYNAPLIPPNPVVMNGNPQPIMA